MNYYDILEVSKDADKELIRKAYKKLAIKWHPDKNTDPKALDKFKAISEAYQVLHDDNKRRIYDVSNLSNLNNFQDFGDLSNLEDLLDPFALFSTILGLMIPDMFAGLLNMPIMPLNIPVTIHEINLTSRGEVHHKITEQDAHGISWTKEFYPDGSETSRISKRELDKLIIGNKHYEKLNM